MNQETLKDLNSTGDRPLLIASINESNHGQFKKSLEEYYNNVCYPIDHEIMEAATDNDDPTYVIELVEFSGPKGNKFELCYIVAENWMKLDKDRWNTLVDRVMKNSDIKTKTEFIKGIFISNQYVRIESFLKSEYNLNGLNLRKILSNAIEMGCDINNSKAIESYIKNQ